MASSNSTSNTRVGEGVVVASFPLTVDHDISVEEMYSTGRYGGQAQPMISNKNFRHLREGVTTPMIDLVQFDHPGTTVERMRQLAFHGELADMDDMLAFGVIYPDEQRQHLIVFLGSSCEGPFGSPHFGYLGGSASQRICDLTMDETGYQWGPQYVFAVRRK